MAKPKKKKKPGFWAKYAFKEISRIQNDGPENELFLLSEEEVQALRKIRKSTFWKVGIAGAMGVILLYAPYHIFGEALFPATDVWIPFYEEYVPIEIGFLIYSLVLVVAEIYYLTFVNIKAVASISHACGYPNTKDTNYENNINALIAVGLEKKQKQLESIGINPYEGLAPIGVIIFQLLLRLKAAATGFLFKLLVTKALGRYALRSVIDFVGIPVYSFWNIWGARKIMNEARVRVMAPPLVKRCADVLYEQQKDNPEFRESIYDMLQLISESKRSFHYNHFLLSVTMLEKFGIEIIEEPPYNDDFIEEVPKKSQLTKDGLQKLFVFGIMIDGAISRREKKAITYLFEKQVLKYRQEEIVDWANDYFKGKGLEEFFQAA